MTAAIQISETEPTALLKDFSEFTTCLTHHPVILATAREFIGGRDLCALNEAMSEPVPETTTRTRQTLYPNCICSTISHWRVNYFTKCPARVENSYSKLRIASRSTKS